MTHKQTCSDVFRLTATRTLNTQHQQSNSEERKEHNTMAPAPLAVKRRREAEKPPIVGIPSKSGSDAKEKKKNSESKFLDIIYKIVGFLWYTLTGLWRKPTDYQLEAKIILMKGNYTPGEFVIRVQRTDQAFGSNPPQKVTNQDKSFRGELRNVGQQEVYETLEQAIKAKGIQGSKGYFLATRLGYDTIAIDPDQMIPSQNW